MTRNKRRTKKDKIIAKLKKEIYKEKPQYSLEASKNIQPKVRNISEDIKEIPSKSYSFVFCDIKKTISITLIILFLNITLYFFIEKDILNFNNLGF